ncbi:hypothetical protein GCM10027174_27680 [Salinifilum aidingensis]
MIPLITVSPINAGGSPCRPADSRSARTSGGGADFRRVPPSSVRVDAVRTVPNILRRNNAGTVLDAIGEHRERADGSASAVRPS